MSNAVASAARIEQNRLLSGNETKNTGQRMNLYSNGVFRDRNGEEVEVSERVFASPNAYKFIIRLDDKPVLMKHIQNLDPMLRVTKGMYMIKFLPKGSYKRKNAHLPFVIGQDLIRWRSCVAGYKHWLKLCKTIPEFAWINRHAYISEELFDFAVHHAGVPVWFCVDWVSYDKLIKSQLKEGEEMLKTHKMSVANYKKAKDQIDKEVQLRVYNDIIKEIEEAEHDPTVQEEMLKYDGGIYARGRHSERDPVTGQWKKKKEI